MTDTINPEIEAMARALCKQYLHGDDPRWWNDEAGEHMQKRLENEWPQFTKQATAARDASRAALDAAGYAIVPREPTDEMKDAAMKAVFDGTRADIHDQSIYETSAFGSGYRAMIAAAEIE